MYRLYKLSALLLAVLLLFCSCKGGKDPSGSADSGNADTPSASSEENITSSEESGSSHTDYDPSGKYALNENKEAIIDDVTFYTEKDTSDNARVFYEIFTCSFSDSNGDGTGDLRGIINRFDYLNDGDPDSGTSLGIEGIWLTPIFKSPSYHKYDVTDFYTIDPVFGTLEDLQELADLCERRNVKLILDLPINHTSLRCQWYKNFMTAHQQEDSSDLYYDFYSWYHEGEEHRNVAWTKVANTSDYVECNFYDGMPELNYDNEAVRQEMLKVAQYWLDQGVDGFRFDAAKYIYYGEESRNADFWIWYMDELKSYAPDIYTVAEVWDADSITDGYYPALNCFNFTVSQVTGLIAKTAKNSPVKNYTDYVASYIERIKGLNEDALYVPFIANHDTDRAAGFLTEASGEIKMAANLYLLGPGSPFIYYGEEMGLRGSRGSENTDANRRLAMVWGDDDTIRDPEGSTYKSQTKNSVKEQLENGYSLLTYYKRLIMIRKANPEIARGTYTSLNLKTGKTGGFISEYEGKKVAVIHNPSEDPADLNLADIGDGSFTTLAAYIGLGEATFIASDGGTTLHLEPQTSVVLR